MNIVQKTKNAILTALDSSNLDKPGGCKYVYGSKHCIAGEVLATAGVDIDGLYQTACRIDQESGDGYNEPGYVFNTNPLEPDSELWKKAKEVGLDPYILRSVQAIWDGTGAPFINGKQYPFRLQEDRFNKALAIQDVKNIFGPRLMDAICKHCNGLILKERDDPWFHDDSGSERCEDENGEETDNFAIPRD
jgi:hypothetical protein